MSNTRGFTLIELMIVVVIVGILSSFAIPRFMGTTNRAKQTEADPILREIYTLQERHRARTGTYAANIGDLEGGAGIAARAEYFQYGLIAHASGFCATATLTPEGAGLTPRSIDASRTFYDGASC